MWFLGTAAVLGHSQAPVMTVWQAFTAWLGARQGIFAVLHRLPARDGVGNGGVVAFAALKLALRSQWPPGGPADLPKLNLLHHVFCGDNSPQLPSPIPSRRQQVFVRTRATTTTFPDSHRHLPCTITLPGIFAPDWRPQTPALPLLRDPCGSAPARNCPVRLLRVS